MTRVFQAFFSLTFAMNIEELHQYLLSKKAVEDCFPFDAETLVFKVAGKMFALLPLERFPRTVNLKCDPDYAQELRGEYDAIQPGFHMNKKHWNTVEYEAIDPKLFRELIDHSYDLVVAGLTKKQKDLFGF